MGKIAHFKILHEENTCSSGISALWIYQSINPVFKLANEIVLNNCVCLLHWNYRFMKQMTCLPLIYFQERRQSAQMLKVEGNELFRCGSYKSAIKVYSRALRTCPLKYAKDRSIMYSNRAVCKLKLVSLRLNVKSHKNLKLHIKINSVNAR